MTEENEKKAEKSFNIRYVIDTDLTISELWPDGDAPESPTAADVEELIEDCGGIERVIRDWGLTIGASLEVG